MDKARYVDPSYRGPAVITGYLKKLKSVFSYTKFLSKFNKRYFELDLNKYTLSYGSKEGAGQKETLSLTNLMYVDPNPRITEVCDWKFAFVAEFSGKIYTLYADSVSAHNEWCYALRACVKPITRCAPVPPQPVPYESAPPDGAGKGSERENTGRTQIIENDDSRSTQAPGRWPVTGQFLEEDAFRRPEVEEQRRIAEQEREFYREKAENANFYQPEREKYREEGYGYREEGELREREEKQQYAKTEGLAAGVEPKLIVVRGDYLPEKREVSRTQTRKTVEKEDEEEFSLVSGPKSNKKNEDTLAEVIPIVVVKDRPVDKHNSPKNKGKKETAKGVEEAKEKVEGKKLGIMQKTEGIAKPSGILDMMSEFDDLGLETVQIRPITTVRSKLKEGSTKETAILSKKEENTREVFQPDRKEENTREVFQPVRKEENAWGVTEQKEKQVSVEKKSAIGNVVLKQQPKKKVVKPVYVEKPDIAPDEDTAFRTPNVSRPVAKVTNNRPALTPSAVYKEANPQSRPQGNDFDWEDWDD
jgi:hypothetical protein